MINLRDYPEDNVRDSSLCDTGAATYRQFPAPPSRLLDFSFTCFIRRCFLLSLRTTCRYYVCSLRAPRKERIVFRLLIWSFIYPWFVMAARQQQRQRPKNGNQKGKSLNLFRDSIDGNVQSALHC